MTNEQINLLQELAAAGWQLVPKAPIPHMLAQGYQAMKKGAHRGRYCRAYKAMIAAAPNHPEFPDSSGIAIPGHKYRELVNALRDVPDIQSRRERISGLLAAYGIFPEGDE